MKILLVDDSKTVVTILKMYITGWHIGAEVLQAGDGDAGLQLALSQQPSIIISDIDMPGLNGFQLCGAIRKDPKLAEVPFFLLSMMGDEASIKQGREAGATDVLKKPVSPQMLRSCLEKYLPRAN